MYVLLHIWQALNYSEDLLRQREVVPVDIASEQLPSGENKPEQVSVSWLVVYNVNLTA